MSGYACIARPVVFTVDNRWIPTKPKLHIAEQRFLDAAVGFWKVPNNSLPPDLTRLPIRAIPEENLELCGRDE